MDRPRLISSGIVLLATLDLLSALSVNGFGAPGAAAPAASSSSPGQLLLVRLEDHTAALAPSLSGALAFLGVQLVTFVTRNMRLVTCDL